MFAAFAFVLGRSCDRNCCLGNPSPCSSMCSSRTSFYWFVFICLFFCLFVFGLFIYHSSIQSFIFSVSSVSFCLGSCPTDNERPVIRHTTVHSLSDAGTDKNQILNTQEIRSLKKMITSKICTFCPVPSYQKAFFWSLVCFGSFLRTLAVNSVSDFFQFFFFF